MGRLVNSDIRGPAYEPVSSYTLTLGRYIAEHSSLERTKLIRVSTGSANTYDQDEIREYLRSDRRRYPIDTQAQPRTVLWLYGKNYGNDGSTEDTFMCRLGVFNLDNGSHLVQAIPYKWEGPSYSYEYAGMRSSLGELFGNARELEEHARINLGTIGADGAVSPIRPFNERAFGMDIVPVLNEINVISEVVDLDFRILEDRIEQF